jgi:membrane-bound lytic murein transglycosylase D
MEEKIDPKNKSNFAQIVVSLSIIAFGVIVAGLFFSSQPVELKRGTDTIQGTQQIFFTPVKLPEKLDFALETVPLENFDVRESLDREMLSIVNFHSQELLYLKKSNRYFSAIEPILKKNEIPDDFKFLALAESGFLDKIVSPSGAVGVWQFMKSAAIENGLEVNDEVDER